MFEITKEDQMDSFLQWIIELSIKRLGPWNGLILFLAGMKTDWREKYYTKKLWSIRMFMGFKL